MDRFQDLQGTFDVAIIGGGIIGAGIARDAALRGLRVALFEKSDYGSGTTSGSTRLIHGGLRYLEMLDFGLVRLDLRERERLLRNAPHLVKPLEFVVPLYERSALYRFKLRAGMLLYDLLSFDKSLTSHRYLNAAETLRAEPQLRREGLCGAFVYSDAQVTSPERLTIENVVEARELGAVALNYAEVMGPLREDGAVTGLRVRDALSGEKFDVRARIVVNAAGPWFDAVAARIEPGIRSRIRTTKGVHLACDPVSRRAVVLFSARDDRLFFVIPWMGYSWVGTTDTDFSSDPSQAHATDEDIVYLRESAGAFFPELRTGPIYWTNAGVRALVMQEGSESSVSRLHRITMDEPGVLSVLGGKITGYRAIAEEVTDAACRALGMQRKCSTADRPLPGGRRRAPDGPLERIYGSRAEEIRRLAADRPELGAVLAPGQPEIAAQVVHAVRHEQCLTVSDFLMRRSLLGFSRDQGRAAAPAVAAWMGRELAWSAARQAEQLDNYEAKICAGVR